MVFSAPNCPLSAWQVAADQFDLQDEIDEVRELMSEERIYRFVLMQVSHSGCGIHGTQNNACL